MKQNNENFIMQFKAVILQNGTMDAAYIIVPYNIEAIYGKKRLLVNATFDGVAYQGQIVKMGSPEYIIGITKAIRQQIKKTFGDSIDVVIQQR